MQALLAPCPPTSSQVTEASLNAQSLAQVPHVRGARRVHSEHLRPQKGFLYSDLNSAPLRAGMGYGLT